MKLVTRTIIWTAGLAVLLFGSILVSAAMGPVRIDLGTVARAVLNTVTVPTGINLQSASAGVGSYRVGFPVPDITYSGIFEFDVERTDQVIVGQLRLPRIMLAAVVGFALATAGTVMQGFFRNPMADPAIIGVSSGAAVGAVATIVFPLAIPFGLQSAAFISGIITAFVVYLIATQDGRTPVATLLLAGIAVQTFLSAVISYMLLQSGENLEEVVLWLMGHLRNSTWGDVEVTLPITILFFGILFAYAQDLNVMLLGEEEAHSLGIEVERTKKLLLAGSAVITAGAVAVAGVIGFVGLIVPHMMRLIVGPDHRILLPTSALAGAVFLVLADTMARSGPEVVPVGIVTAAIGAPFFLFLLRRREVHEL